MPGVRSPSRNNASARTGKRGRKWYRYPRPWISSGILSGPVLLLPAALATSQPLREEKRKFHILLEEDSAVNQRLAMRLLEKHGHNVRVVASGRQA